jgi:predicted nucleic acid-binding protein
MSISIALLPDENAVMELARRHRLSFYDAAYLELALREALTLATFDGDLIVAARAEGVALA